MNHDNKINKMVSNQVGSLMRTWNKENYLYKYRISLYQPRSSLDILYLMLKKKEKLQSLMILFP